MKHPEDNRGPRVPNMLNIETLGEAMRPEKLRGEAFRLSREERDHIAGHALDSVCTEAQELARLTHPNIEGDYKHLEAHKCSGVARKIAALSNLLGDIGWERSEAQPLGEGYLFGELFPVAQLRPWLEEWQREDNEALVSAEQLLEAERLSDKEAGRSLREAPVREAIADAQTKLDTGAILLARIEKWMASHEN